MLRMILGVESSLRKLCAFPDYLWLFAKCYFGLIRVHLGSVAQLTDDLHAQSSLQAQHRFHFYWWKAFHTWDHPQHPHILLWIFCVWEKLLNETKSALCRLVQAYRELLKEIFPNGLEILGWFVALLTLQNCQTKTSKNFFPAGPRCHWDIYRSGQGSSGRKVGPNQIGSNKGPDCSHSIRGKEVRGRVQEGERGSGICRDNQEHKWASGVMLEAPSKGMLKDCDLCDQAGWNWTFGGGKWCWVLADVA